jgi:hypothetical protein
MVAHFEPAFAFGGTVLHHGRKFVVFALSKCKHDKQKMEKNYCAEDEPPPA